LSRRARVAPTASMITVLAATLGAHEYWLAHPDEDLPTVHERFLRLLLPRETR
ncbi:acyl-CoA-like ligand-binding transcription factor, partial [Pseudonocardia pini]|uniref:acyl-CoA-like ligand-binding transcription factor n=1 Tax=Pseudonocardia pini TaxID=2758030 RepID=UPI001C693F2E